MLLALLSTCKNENVDQTQTSETMEATEGVSPSGYKYVHHIKNDGPKPQEGDQVTYHNIVFQNDTTLLSSTYYKIEPQSAILPTKNELPNPPPPDYEGLLLMSVGDSLTIFQELDTFPVEKLPKGITNEDRFKYQLKLVSIKPKAVIDKEIADLKARDKTVADSTKMLIDLYEKGELDDQLKTMESGVKYIIHREGDGKKMRDGGFAKVLYSGFLMDGTQFDGTFEKARPLPVRIGRGQVIAGWDEAIPMLTVGSQATLFIPYTSAYGEAGKPPTIPERADLVFYVEIVQIY